MTLILPVWGSTSTAAGSSPAERAALHPLDVAVLELMQHVRHGNPPCHPITKRPPPLAHRPGIVNNPFFLQENFQGGLENRVCNLAGELFRGGNGLDLMLPPSKQKAFSRPRNL